MKPLHVDCQSLSKLPLGSPDAADCLDAMLRLEETTYSAPYRDYLASVLSTKSKPLTKGDFQSASVVDEQCHVKMYTWCYQIVECFKFHRETVYVSMSNLSRFLSSKAGRPYLHCRHMYQLAALTSLHIAIKMHESKILDLNFLTQLSGHSYSAGQILNMESRILTALNWTINPPTPMAYVRYLIGLMPSNVDLTTSQNILNVALFQTELSVLHYTLAVQSASTIGVAAILNAISGIDDILLPAWSRDEFILKLEDRRFNRHTRGVMEAQKVLVDALAQGQPMYQQTTNTPERPKLSSAGRSKSDGNFSPASVACSGGILHGNPEYERNTS